MLNDVRSGWIRFEKIADDEQARLFCFPFAGGGASSFLPWKSLLPDDISLFPVQLPGHEDRYGEQAITEMERLCEEAAGALLPLFTRKTAFFGHSMGGLLAFCLARWLKRRGLPSPVHLFISAAPTPVLPEELPPETVGDEAFLERVLQCRAIPDQVLLDEESLGMVKKTLLDDHRLLLSMIDGDEEPLNIPISVFAGEKDILVPFGRVGMWKNFTTETCSMALWPGGHFYVRKWRAELVEQIAQSLLMYAF